MRCLNRYRWRSASFSIRCRSFALYHSDLSFQPFVSLLCGVELTVADAWRHAAFCTTHSIPPFYVARVSALLGGCQVVTLHRRRRPPHMMLPSQCHPSRLAGNRRLEGSFWAPCGHFKGASWIIGSRTYYGDRRLSSRGRLPTRRNDLSS